MAENQSGETWIQTQWRPLVAMAYIIIILFDFVVGPILWTSAQALFSGAVTQPWVTLTLEAGGLFHIGMSAILGISAYARGNEKAAELRQHAEDMKAEVRRGSGRE